MGKFVHVVPGDRISMGSTVYIVDQRPEDWPHDWRHGVTYGADRPCEPAGERCGPHGCSWPPGDERCLIGAIWDKEQT
jgi:hypothetical protein